MRESPPFNIASGVWWCKTEGMKALYAVLLALVLGVGCGEGEEKATPKVEPKVEVKRTEPPKETPKKLIVDPIVIVERAIRGELKKPTGELTKEDLEKVTVLDLSRQNLTAVPKELAKLTQLTVLGLNGNQLTDVKGLEKLTQLTRLELRLNQLTDVKGLENLTQLMWLELGGNQLTSVKGLEKLTQLMSLDLTLNPDLTKAQIDELKKALPKCGILHNTNKVTP